MKYVIKWSPVQFRMICTKNFKAEYDDKAKTSILLSPVTLLANFYKSGYFSIFSEYFPNRKKNFLGQMVNEMTFLFYTLRTHREYMKMDDWIEKEFVTLNIKFCALVIPPVCPCDVFWPFVQNNFKDLSNFLHECRGQ